MTPFRTYREVLAYLFDKLPMYQRVGAPAFKKDLTNTLRLLEVAGNPHESLTCIHIAGTNGKGSTSHLIAGGLQANGYRTGLYTSPHYKDFRERIKIDGQYITPAYIKKFINTYYHAIEEIQPSFFELTVVLAFSYFRDQHVDYAVIETGLGGRLDSTNVITPILSVITNISYDHMNMLGDTLELIAYEKAGIIKPGVPVLIGEMQPEVAGVFRKKASESRSDILFAPDFTDVIQTRNYPATYKVNVHEKTWIPSIRFDIGGPYQAHNLRTAFAALYLLQEKISLDAGKWPDYFPSFSKHTRFMGRWQILSEKPLIVADSAHNEGGLHYVLDHLQSLKTRQIHFVLGFVNDKELGKILDMFPDKGVYYFAKANIPRGLPAHELKEVAARHGLRGKAYTSVKRAFVSAKKSMQPDDILFVGGSIFVVAEIL